MYHYYVYVYGQDSADCYVAGVAAGMAMSTVTVKVREILVKSKIPKSNLVMFLIAVTVKAVHQNKSDRNVINCLL